MNNSIVSIIMPNYNGGMFISESIRSVVEQTYCDWELIILDDGSTDNSIHIASEYASRDERIRLIDNSRNDGPFRLRNIGLKKSIGSYIAFIDSDDLWHCEKLKQQMDYVRKSPVPVLCHTKTQRIDEKGKNHPGRYQDNADYIGKCFDKMIKRNGVVNSSVLVAREIFDKVGPFDEEFRFRGDWEMWVRISHEYEYMFIDEPLTYYRIHCDNISRDYKRIRPFAFAIIDKFIRNYGDESRTIANTLEETKTDLFKQYGIMALIVRDYASARCDLNEVLNRRPFDAGAILGLVKSYLYPIIGKK